MKRTVDVVIASALVIVLLPLIIAIVTLVLAESHGGGFLYRARRVGRNGALFDVLKFRKMVDVDGPPITVEADPRFTRIGRVLAHTKLDEIPQLLNVIRGDMSLVGPRPEDPRFVEMFSDEFATILTARPGITGVAQLAYVRESSILDAEDPVTDYVGRILPSKMQLDALYATRPSLMTDLRVLFWTFVATVTRREVAVSRSTLRCSIRQSRAAGTPDVPRGNATAGAIVTAPPLVDAFRVAPARSRHAIDRQLEEHRPLCDSHRRV